MKAKFDKKIGVWHGATFNETYAFELRVVWPCDNDRLRKYLRTYFPGTEGAIAPDEREDWVGRTYEVRTNDHKKEVQVVALQSWKGTPFCHSVLTHEVLHVVHHVLGGRGMTMTDESVEAYTYLLDSLINQSLKIITQKPKKRKHKK